MTCVPASKVVCLLSQVTASEILPPNLSIGIKNGLIHSIAVTLDHCAARSTLDAEGGYVTPGGIDSHVHLHQDNAPTGDKWLSGSRSALAGGNTTIIAFATQQRYHESLYPVIEEYHRRAKDQSYVDYGFHLILTNPTPQVLNELGAMVTQEGITSCKLYMTYPAFKLGDRGMLEIMDRCRELGMTTMVHAENSDMIDMVTERLIASGSTEPKYHAMARPQIAEVEATNRAISLSSLVSAPILLVHMSAPEGVKRVRSVQGKELLPVHAETCPHYLFLRSEKIAATAYETCDEHGHGHEVQDNWAGARHVCAPPLRHEETDLQALWDAINNGTITVVSSDHAPTRWEDGKRKPLVAAMEKGVSPVFKDIPNGLPGIETRLPLLFHAATSKDVEAKRRTSLTKFVEVTSSNAAKLYGLGRRKGVVAPGFEADLVVWYPKGDERGKTIVRNGILHHSIDYTPFEGMEVDNWPRWTILRGKVAWDRDKELAEDHGKGLLGQPGDGVFLKRGPGEVLVGRVGVTPRGMRAGERKAWGLDV